jgi:hypothetical protein
LSQWTTEASSHHSNKRGMTLRCAPETMKDRIAASSDHTVRVQKAKPASRSVDTARLPAAALAWRAARNVWKRKAGRYRQDRTRRRVIDTSGMTGFTWLDQQQQSRGDPDLQVNVSSWNSVSATRPPCGGSRNQQAVPSVNC